MEPFEKENAYFRAQKRVRRIKKFYISLMWYFVVVLAFAGLNYYTNELRYPWFLWIAFGWGIGIIFQAIKAFEHNALFGTNWEERKIRKFMEEEEKKNPQF